jgi:hypothetical protein
LNINTEQFKGEYKGMSLNTFCKFYSTKNAGENHIAIKGYKVPKQNEKESLNSQHVLKYPKEDKNKSYMDVIVAHAKEVPDPRKYSRVVTWATPNIMHTKGFLRQERITLFDELSKSSKGMPGPATYKKEKSQDKFSSDRIKGCYKR